VRLEGHSSGVNSALFSPDGQRILTASEDGTARVWRTYPDVESMLFEAARSLKKFLNSEAYSALTEA
jgi:WD40 repeat protein